MHLCQFLILVFRIKSCRDLISQLCELFLHLIETSLGLLALHALDLQSQIVNLSQNLSHVPRICLVVNEFRELL